LFPQAGSNNIAAVDLDISHRNLEYKQIYFDIPKRSCQ